SGSRSSGVTTPPSVDVVFKMPSGKSHKVMLHKTPHPGGTKNLRLPPLNHNRTLRGGWGL
ncbi:hypothetical protein, partial [Enterobacter sichuanensis]